MEIPPLIAEEGAKLLGIAAFTKMLLDNGGEVTFSVKDFMKVAQEYTFRIVSNAEKQELVFQIITRERAMELINNAGPDSN